MGLTYNNEGIPEKKIEENNLFSPGNYDSVVVVDCKEVSLRTLVIHISQR